MKLYPNLMKLNTYVPKDRFITSQEEMDMISETLELDKASDDDVYNYKSLVTSVWGIKYIQLDPYSSIACDCHTSMMSITAVLDNEMVERGMEV